MTENMVKEPKGLESEFPLMTTNDVADLLSIKRGTLDIWRSDGKGPVFFKVGRGVRYRKEDVDAWLRAQEPVQSTTAQAV